MHNEYPSLVKLLVFFFILAIILLLVSCSNAYEECIEQQKGEYRSRNPSASYGQIVSRSAEFEMMCSRFKS
jgi:hypothetical protein